MKLFLERIPKCLSYICPLKILEAIIHPVAANPNTMKLIPKKRFLEGSLNQWLILSLTQNRHKRSLKHPTTWAHEKTKGEQSHGMSVHREQFKQENYPL